MPNGYKQIRVADRQTLVDIAIRHYGSYEGLFLLIADNLDRITDIANVPEPGLLLNIREGIPRINSNNRTVAGNYEDAGVAIVSGATEVTPVAELITGYVATGYWDSKYVKASDGLTYIVSNVNDEIEWP